LCQLLIKFCGIKFQVFTGSPIHPPPPLGALSKESYPSLAQKSPKPSKVD
jgi:hypothetical protein